MLPYGKTASKERGKGASLMEKKSGDAGRKLSRGDFLRIGGGGLAGAALLGAAGCGGGSSSGGSGSGGPVNITVAFGREASGTLAQLIKEFNKQNGGKIKVTWRHMPSDTGQYFNQIQTEFQAQKTNIDLIGGDVIWPAQLAANGWILDLSDRFTESDQKKFLPGPIQSMTWQGKIWGVPWFTDAGMLYYRKDLLAKSGYKNPPKTWDELKSMAKKITKEQGIQNGFVFQGDKYEGGVCDAMEYIWTNGGNVLKDYNTNTVVVGQPPAIQGIATERSMVTSGVAPQAVATYQEPQTEPVFLGGKAVFARNWPYMYGLASQYKMKPSQIGLAPIPVSGNNETASCLGGWNFYISALSDKSKQDAAYKFIQFMTSPENEKKFAIKGGYLPTLSALYKDKELLNKVPTMRNSAAISHTHPRPVSPYYSDMSLKMQEQFNDSLKGTESPKQAADTLQKQLTQIIKQGKNA